MAPVAFPNPGGYGTVLAGPIVARYIEHMRLRNLRPWTVYGRERALARLGAWHGGPILYLTYAELYRWQLDRAKSIQPEPQRTELSHARQFYRWAVREGLIRDDPTDRLILPRVHQGLPRPIGDGDLAVAMEGALPETKAILGLAAFAGLRACEIAGLDWADVGLGEKYPGIRIFEGKGGHGRIVPLSDALDGVLRELPHRRGPVIRRADGRAGPNEAHRISSMANTYLHALGIVETLHQLRHRFATSTYQACRDIRAIQDLLGHASPRTTSRYAAAASDVAIGAVQAAGMIAVAEATA
jgi:integrase/recombinase XerC